MTCNSSGLVPWTAVAAFFFSAGSLYTVESFRIRIGTLYLPIKDPVSIAINAVDEVPNTWPQVRRVTSFLTWLVVVVPLCSIVPAVNGIADFISKDAQVGGVALYPIATGVRSSVGVLMWLISSIVMPLLARRIAGSPGDVCQMLIYARLIINQVITGLVTFWLHEDCMGKWLQYFFRECDSTSAFLVSGVASRTNEYVHSDGRSKQTPGQLQSASSATHKFAALHIPHGSRQASKPRTLDSAAVPLCRA